jgi:predicted tellurium resistance membrane protein TerC
VVEKSLSVDNLFVFVIIIGSLAAGTRLTPARR